MLSRLFLAVIFALVACLSLFEVLKYRSAARAGGPIDYPRRRLIRRITTAALVLGIVSALTFKPGSWSAMTDLMWYGGCLIATLAVIWLAFRDLHETSVSVVAAHKRFVRETEGDLTKKYAGERKKGKRAKKK